MPIVSEGDPFAPFRPRRGRYVALVVGALILALFGLGAVVMPGPEEMHGGWQLPDRIALALFGLAMAAFVWRYAALKAVPTTDGLTIRNLVFTRRVDWSEVIAVNFAGGDPWPRLDLADTEQVAVMAVQKADGAYGRAEAARLAALVEALSTADPTES